MVMVGHQFSLPCSMELQRKTSSCCACIEEKAPRKQDKRKRETKTKRGVTVANERKSYSGREKREGERDGSVGKGWWAVLTANEAGRESMRAQ